MLVVCCDGKLILHWRRFVTSTELLYHEDDKSDKQSPHGTNAANLFRVGVVEPAVSNLEPAILQGLQDIGVAVAMGQPDERILAVLRQIQNDLFDAGAFAVGIGSSLTDQATA